MIQDRIDHTDREHLMSWTCNATFSGHRGSVYALAADAADGAWLSAGGDGDIVRWNSADPEKGIVLARMPQAIFSLFADHARGLLFAGDEAGGLHVIDLTSKRETQLLHPHRKGLFAVVPLAADRLACAGGDGSITIWRIVSGEAPTLTLLRQIPLCEEKVRGLAVSNDRSMLVVACGDGSVRVLDTTEFNERYTLDAHTDGASSVSFHPGKPVLVSGGKDGHLRFWRTDDRFSAMHGIPAHKGSIYAIGFSPDGSVCATAGRDKCAKLWDAASFEPLEKLDRTMNGHTHSVNALLWPSTNTLITASDDRTLRAWRSNGPHP